MFRNVIPETPFTERGLQFSIDGDMPWNDATFLTTLRALLDDKIKPGDRVYFQYSPLRSHVGSDLLYHAYALGDDNEGVISLMDVYLDRVNKSFEQFVEDFRSGIKDDDRYAKSWVEIPKVNAFFIKAFEVHCFINAEARNVLLITHELDVKKMHYLQCAIPAFMPWYFPKDNGISDEEMQLIKSLADTDPAKYIGIIESTAQKKGLKEKRLRDLLSGIEMSVELERREQLKCRIQEVIRSLDDIDYRISELLKQKTEYETDLLGVETKLANSDDNNEILEYFMCNKKLALKNRYGQNITFVANDYLTYFDEEAAERVINNKRSFVYTRDRGVVSKKDMEFLMRAIFLDQVLRVRFCAAYDLNISGTIRPIQGYSFGTDSQKFTPNPHINTYTCLGDYKRHILDRLRDHDYIGAIEQCVASCKSLNLLDSCVMERFMDVLYGHCEQTVNRCFIEMPDGKIGTPEEAVEWLKESGYIAAEEEGTNE